MSYLDLLRNSIASVFTPVKALERKRPRSDRNLMPPPPMTRPFRLDDREMTPISKTTHWLEQTSASPSTENSSSTSKTPNVLKVNSSAKILKRSPAARKPGNDGYRPDVEEDHDYDSDDDLDGPTLMTQSLPQHVHAPHDALPPSSAIKKKTARFEEGYRPRKDDEEDEEEDEDSGPQIQIVKGSKNEVLTQYDMEKARRYAESARLPAGQHWSQTERDLFQRLALRGFEPLIPSNWAMDFRTFPTGLFATEEQTPIIYPLYGSEFRAIHALQSLVRLGPIARDKLMCRLRPEKPLRRTLKNYMKWVTSDANMPKYPSSGIPVHTIVSLKPGQDKADTVKRLATKLHGLAEEWRDAYSIESSVEDSHSMPGSPSKLRRASVVTANTLTSSTVELPILTGILVIHSLVAVVTLDPNEASRGDPAEGQNQVRQLIVINFGYSAYDVWNAFAVAIVGMHLRTVRMEFEKRAEGVMVK